MTGSVLGLPSGKVSEPMISLMSVGGGHDHLEVGALAAPSRVVKADSCVHVEPSDTFSQGARDDKMRWPSQETCPQFARHHLSLDGTRPMCRTEPTLESKDVGVRGVPMADLQLIDDRGAMPPEAGAASGRQHHIHGLGRHSCIPAATYLL